MGRFWTRLLLIGLAFVVWDIGMKQGDVALLGVASYAAPVLSTIILVLAGYAAASWLLAGYVAMKVLHRFGVVLVWHCAKADFSAV